MELVINPKEHQSLARNYSDARFIQSNTKPVTLKHLQEDCVIPVFAKDNEPAISHADFVQSVFETVEDVFLSEVVLKPSIRVSHPVKGRIPEAKNKRASELLDEEKTIYYERMMFVIEVPSVYRKINGNHLNLSIGGVRSFNQENLHAKRGLQKFKIFIGFRNRVCCNMCVLTDGVLDELKVGSIGELKDKTEELLLRHDSAHTLGEYEKWHRKMLSKEEFTQFLGHCRMLNHMPLDERRGFSPVQFTDHQINLLVDGYYNDDNFSRYSDGSISLWNLYNLLTGANKQSYIDSFLLRGLNAATVVNNISSYIG